MSHRFGHDWSDPEKMDKQGGVKDTNESESQKHFKRLLDKQLTKTVNLKQLAEEKRNFVKSSYYLPITQDLRGQLDLESYKSIEQEKSRTDYLQRCGLNSRDIQIWREHEHSAKDFRNVSIEPEVLQRRLETIKNKIETKEEELNKPSHSRDVRLVNRHEMEIECSVKCNAEYLQKLVQVESTSTKYPHPDDPMNHLAEIEAELFSNHKKSRSRKRKKIKMSAEERINIVKKTDDTDVILNVSTCARRPITNEEIKKNRLSDEQIRQIPKFSAYSSGIPSNSLYLKNLSKQVIEDDLVLLFHQFNDGANFPEIKLLNGRMHGQAFVKFQDENLATKALQLLNGYLLYNRPIIIQYKT